MKVGEAEREYVVAEALSLAEAVGDGESRSAYQEIAWAADRGEVPEGLAGRVGELVALAVETGRARSVRSAANENKLGVTVGSKLSSSRSKESANNQRNRSSPSARAFTSRSRSVASSTK